MTGKPFDRRRRLLIDLKDFVKETLVQIAAGVREAQEALADSDAQVNPSVSGEPGSVKGAYAIDHRRMANSIELDIAVLADESKGVVAAPADTTAEAGVSRIRFRIGVVLPTAEPEKKSATTGSNFELEV
jgi:hypothetical protein